MTDNINQLLAIWDKRSKDALPVCSMLINRHIRELREAIAQSVPPTNHIANAGNMVQPSPVTQAEPLKDGEIAKVVNDLRDVALQFHGAQQLRERIAHIVVPLFKSKGGAA